MHARWLIIDGNNLIHSDLDMPRELLKNFDRARASLVQRLDRLVGVLADRITIVFDGRGSGGPSESASAVEVVFSPSRLTADSVIERLVRTAASPAGIAVITSDRLERDSVEAAGIQSVSCRSFLEILRKEESHPSIKPTRNRAPRPTLGDLFPPPPSKKP